MAVRWVDVDDSCDSRSGIENRAERDFSSYVSGTLNLSNP